MMIETSKKLTETTDEIISLATKKLFDPETLKNMDVDEFKLLQLTIEYVSTSNKLIIETAEMMNSMNEKLEKLLSK